MAMPWKLTQRRMRTPMAVAALADDVEAGEGGNDPAFEITDEASDIVVAPLQVEHHVGDALAGAMIGVSAAAAGFVDRKALRRQQFGGVGAGPGGVYGGMFEQPNGLRRGADADFGGAIFHEGDGGLVVDQLVANPPFYRR
jgi:hypothetical protein